MPTPTPPPLIWHLHPHPTPPNPPFPAGHASHLLAPPPFVLHALGTERERNYEAGDGGGNETFPNLACDFFFKKQLNVQYSESEYPHVHKDLTRLVYYDAIIVMSTHQRAEITIKLFINVNPSKSCVSLLTLNPSPTFTLPIPCLTKKPATTRRLPPCQHRHERTTARNACTT